eukprot:CAMPEP_0197034114 /NCGR_PEP_ID=MMETSP1384-20130603/12315_1 /TAXON_ID=29189 /ORGANISM="Ammonia sp." /LENGTH=819 /DNA_ID=CAMNT_0042463999 /DNA_START=39 /DNA_END=2498 /DNA_ORIENTATION=-
MEELEALQLGGDSDGGEKKRRFSVHDVVEEDNDVKYGQIDNQAIINNNPTRIASVDDHDTDDDEKVKSTNRINRSSIHSDNKSEEDEHANVFIADNVDDNDEYANGHIEYSDDMHHDTTSAPNDMDAKQSRDSKENTPNANAADKDNEKEAYHYRHPSLAPDENPASDDEELDKDHARFASTLIHAVDESDEEQYGEEPNLLSPAGGQTKNVSRLYDYWCHSSPGIAIEDDTDAKLSRDKQQLNGYQQSSHSHSAGKESYHEINNYTRPFMSKIESNSKWDSVFGNGIISDTHDKYRNRDNGSFIEWIIEINNMDSTLYKGSQATMMMGISSDLLGDSNTDAFAFSSTGYGFDNLGNILHEKKVDHAKSLQFEKRDVVHIILDYSNSLNWVLYAKVGDIDEEDYEDLSNSTKITTVFSKITPGSYRLAVSLYSMDALVIESCKIHGSEHAEFYQELKSYSTNNKHEEQEDEKDEQLDDNNKQSVPATSTAEQSENAKLTEAHTDTDDVKVEVEEKQTTESIAQSTQETVVEEKVNEPSLTATSNQNAETHTEDSAAVNESKESEELIAPQTTVFKPMNAELSPSPNLLSPPPTHQDDASDHEDDKLKPLYSQKSVIVHSDVDEDGHHQTPDAHEEHERKLQEQLQVIEDLQKQIQEMQTQNEAKQKLIDEAAEKDKQQKHALQQLEEELATYKERASTAEAQVKELESTNLEQQQQLASSRDNATDTKQIAKLTEENERLSHELKLAQDRAKTMEDTKKEMQERLNNAVESKMKLIISTSEEIDHYRKLIQQIAQNKLGCQLLSDFTASSHQNGKNGYY